MVGVYYHSCIARFTTCPTDSGQWLNESQRGSSKKEADDDGTPILFE
jgi:hypothetical protein